MKGEYMKKKRKFSNLFKKLKKANPYYRFTFFTTYFIHFLSAILLIYSLCLLSGIENLIRVIIIIVIVGYLLIILITGPALLITKKHGRIVLISIMALIFSIINIVGYSYIKKTFNVVENISKEKIIYTTNLLALTKEQVIKKVGLLKDDNSIEGNILPQEYMATNNKKWKISYYKSNDELLNALNN